MARRSFCHWAFPLVLGLAGCANVRTINAAAAEALRPFVGRPVVLRVRGEGYVRGRLGAVAADTLWLRDRNARRPVPSARVCAATVQERSRHVGVGKIVGGALGVAVGLVAVTTTDDGSYFSRELVALGAAATVPYFVLVGGVVGRAVTPATRYVFDGRCR